MVEVEVKFFGADFAGLGIRLAAWGATAQAPIQEADHYFNAPDRDFAKTDEALRVRRIGADNRVTYKGPKRDAQTKTRTEVEVGLAGGDAAAADFCKILTLLGYRPVAVVRKSRTIFHLERDSFRIEICLDEVENLGRFVELEIGAEESNVEAARDVLLACAADLGLTGSERRSYLEMLLVRGKGPLS